MITKENNQKELRKAQIIYKGECIDSNDPMRLGRIRAILKTENTEDRELANENLGKQTYVEWDERDPFVFKPLLPFFINTPPKENEYVHLFYNNPKRKGDKDKFYIGGVYSSPTTSEFERYDSAVTNFDEGSRNKSFPNLLNNDGEYFYKDTEGIYADPQDIGIYGRGSSDIIIKDNTVLLRAGKNLKYERGQVPRKNENRSFIQLSKFDYKTSFGSPEKKLVLRFQHQELKKLVEYTIVNPENIYSAFTGNLYIYNLSRKNGLSVSTSDITVSKEIPENSKSLQTTISFSQKTMLQVIKIINDTLEGLIKGDISSIENVTISGPQKFDQGNTFPFYFRPQKVIYDKVSSDNPTSNAQEIHNINELISKVKILPSEINSGYGLVYDKNKTNSVPFKPISQSLIPKKTERYNKSVGIMGGDEIYLLSHNSQKFDSNGKIDLTNTLYGIDENKIANEIEPKTSSLVRGEELLELINLIVRYLVGHVHPYPGLEPVPQSIDGVKVDDILQELLNATDKILNKNIRIN